MTFEMSDQSAILPMEGEETKKGLSVGVAAVFIVGTMCGSGILALPKALVDAGWAGIALLILCGLLSSYTGSILGKCWTVLRMRYPQYSHFVSDPYPAIAFRATGKWGEYATHFCIVATLFGGATVFLLLIAGNISNLIESLGNFNMAACYWIVIIAATLIPLTWLGTPKDFWQAGIIAAATTTVGGLLIVIGLATMDIDMPVYHNNPSFAGFFNAFGTILFAFGGASCFPTIQVDMKNPDKFPLAVVIGIMCVLALYIPVSVTGFVVLGNTMHNSNILDEMAKNGILWAVIILITFHLFMAFLIVINPINQALDLIFKLENKFSIKRCAVRSCTMLLVLFVALSIPKFGVILSLVGGTTITATNFIFPPLFYILLSRQKCAADSYGPPPEWEPEEPDIVTTEQVEGDYPTAKAGKTDRRSSSDIPWTQFDIPLYVKVLLVEIILVGVFGGVASTYSVVAQLVDGSSGFSVPCYVNWHIADH